MDIDFYSKNKVFTKCSNLLKSSYLLTSISSEEKAINSQISDTINSIIETVYKKLKQDKSLELKPAFKTKLEKLVKAHPIEYIELMNAMGLDYTNSIVITGMKGGKKLAKNLTKLLNIRKTMNKLQ